MSGTERLESRLVESGLVLPHELHDALASQPAPQHDEELLGRLIQLGRLTVWQAGQLRVGKSHGFVLGAYRLLEPLGRGGMGLVFRAVHTRANRLVAVKILPGKRANASSLRRFQREAETALTAEHPHVVRMIELGEQGGAHFLVLELIDGTDLGRYIKKKGQLDERETARIGCEIASALEHARRHQIIHRDVKPQNILLTRTGRAKLTDFGLATLADPDAATNLTQHGALLGTIDYMAPEQAEDPRQADTRSDIYSLGCTLYHCLGGQVPFPEATPVKKLLAHRTAPPTPLGELNPRVSERLAELITDRMMAKSPDDRIQTPAEIAVALRPWATGTPDSTSLGLLASLVDDAAEPESAPSHSDPHPESEPLIRFRTRTSIWAMVPRIAMPGISWHAVRLLALLGALLLVLSAYRNRDALLSRWIRPPATDEPPARQSAVPPLDRFRPKNPPIVPYLVPPSSSTPP